jgi:hypothetical protein
MASHSGTSSGPFTVTVSNLSFGSRGSFRHRCSKAHLPTSAPLRARPPRAGIRPVMPRRSAEWPTVLPRVSCRLSATGIRFLGILFPPGISALLTVGLPSKSPDPGRGFHVPHIRDATGLGALFTPRPSGALTAGPIPPAAARPLCQEPGPITPVFIHLPELSLTGRHQGFTRVRPPGLPPRLDDPRMERRPLGLLPGLRTPTGQDLRRTPERGTGIEHSPGAT